MPLDTVRSADCPLCVMRQKALHIKRLRALQARADAGFRHIGDRLREQGLAR